MAGSHEVIGSTPIYSTRRKRLIGRFFFVDISLKTNNINTITSWANIETITDKNTSVKSFFTTFFVGNSSVIKKGNIMFY